MACNPYTNDSSSSSVSVDVGSIGWGEIHVIVYAFGSGEIWPCRSQMAYIQMCATEREAQGTVVVPLVAYMNICADQPGSALHAGSTPALRYRTYMHELIHILGFTEVSSQ
jgi:hypothetical protein